jgi:hypothetical protein
VSGVPSAAFLISPHFFFHGDVSQSIDQRFIGVIDVEADGIQIALFDAKISPKQRLTRIN